MPQDGHWLASFEVIPPPKKLVFPRPKKWRKFPTENCFPDPIFFLKILAFYCLCGENFVTPFSTLAMIQGSLPTNSTTPDRLRLWTKTESEDFPGFWVRTLSKKFFSEGPRSQSIGRGRISREGALDLRESWEQRDKFFAEKTENAKIFQNYFGSEAAVFSGEFSFFWPREN